MFNIISDQKISKHMQFVQICSVSVGPVTYSETCMGDMHMSGHDKACIYMYIATCSYIN